MKKKKKFGDIVDYILNKSYIENQWNDEK